MLTVSTRIAPLRPLMVLLMLAGVAPCVQAQAEPRSAWTDADWRILESTIQRASRERLDTLPIGAAIARVGGWFVGAPYRPGTLEEPGAEHLVINLREFDCVTFVENVLALVRFARHDGAAALADSAAAKARYASYLTALRYRDGRLDGYASRLHYFSEWLADHERRGFLHVQGDELGADTDRRPITFMTAHATAYRQLADPAERAAIAAIERRLSAAPARRFVPKDRIAEIEDRIADGDLLAMTSTLEGLDVVHVGIAVRRNGRVHLLNAPLVGRSVEVSALPLPAHLAERPRQAGVMVARVLEGWGK